MRINDPAILLSTDEPCFFTVACTESALTDLAWSLQRQAPSPVTI